MKKPKLVDISRTIELIEIIEGCSYTHFKDVFYALDAQGWKFLPVKQTRGRCYFATKTITIPSWAFTRKEPEYLIYYIAHEMAHARKLTKNHGEAFMAEFKSICPQHLWHFELEYKPQNAAAAGISILDAYNF